MKKLIIHIEAAQPDPANPLHVTTRNFSHTEGGISADECGRFCAAIALAVESFSMSMADQFKMVGGDDAAREFLDAMDRGLERSSVDQKSSRIAIRERKV